MIKKAKLVHGNGADSYYGAGMYIPDPFTWYQDSKGKTHIILSALEVDRGRKHATVDAVHAMGDFVEKLQKLDKKASEANIIGTLISEDAPDEIAVPYDFPAGLYASLTEQGFNLKPTDILFEGRAVKTPEQIEKLRTAQHINQKGFERAFAIFRAAEIAKDNTLFWKGEALTSEIIQNEMNVEILRNGGKAFNDGPIVACGAQSADPHERGHGPLKAHEFIIIDSFPQGPEVYNGDLTRTILKGTPTQWHLDIYAAVKTAQQLGLDMIKEGVNGKDINSAVMKSLEDSGFPVGVDAQGRNYGMFHGTGHGVGLEVHDFPQGTISRRDCILQAGHVTSVEPGLYYPEKGGCRIEDVAAVTKDGVDNLTTLPKELVI